jgi:hypothetical protein
MSLLTLKRLLKNKKALSTPIGNLIILLAAVVLSTTVVIFAINVMTFQAQKEKVYVDNTHIWYIDPTKSLAAIALTDTGPTDVVITKINIKGIQCQWDGTDNFVVYCKINGTMPADLQYVTNIDPAVTTTINIADQPYDFTVASEGLTIQSENSIAFYIIIPNTIMLYDLSEPVRIIINTTQGVYLAEAAVQVAP